MMTLELMARFFESVDEEWRSPIASSVAAAWFGGEVETWVWRASANFVCVVMAAGRKYYLRINHESERQPDLIAAELAFVEALNGASISVATPVRSTDGSLVESVSTPLGLCHAVMFEALPGEHRELDEMTGVDFEAWGQALGAVHACSSRLSAINRPAWSDNLNLAKRLIPAQAGAARREIHAVEAALESLPRSRENFGLIHYDFELDNLMWDSGHIGILDFDDCAYCWFAADIAYALRDLFADRVGGVDLDDASLQSFVRGYRDEQPLSDEEIERLPLYLRLHNLVSYARITRALGESVPPQSRSGRRPSAPNCWPRSTRIATIFETSP